MGKAESDLGLHCLPLSKEINAMPIWVMRSDLNRNYLSMS